MKITLSIELKELLEIRSWRVANGYDVEHIDKKIKELDVLIKKGEKNNG